MYFCFFQVRSTIRNTARYDYVHLTEKTTGVYKFIGNEFDSNIPTIVICYLMKVVTHNRFRDMSKGKLNSSMPPCPQTSSVVLKNQWSVIDDFSIVPICNIPAYVLLYSFFMVIRVRAGLFFGLFLPLRVFRRCFIIAFDLFCRSRLYEDIVGKYRFKQVV